MKPPNEETRGPECILAWAILLGLTSKFRLAASLLVLRSYLLPLALRRPLKRPWAWNSLPLGAKGLLLDMSLVIF